LEIADNFFSDPPLYDFEHTKWLNSKNTDGLDLITMFRIEGWKF